ncbi:class A beta-lactamase-related serine hydrolase [Atlantibacter subterranea]|jgi:CubicO group peptidase (beta-lactamase class C family)|uniref:Class A beta-lactamase-related serine hydrolase n=1 Tax=Atlantibacter subterraneus TaxID=255519 RepID=A0A3R9F567_9ENTR|nr:serine hydrolase domain-containing protein [Atlantibacter subterranea]MDA3131855.1 serine hydrolase [Atlantibacter subterranea]RSB62231.1 class A beta-lactamase-related serine hydrolase [Atlantibacter subterranea]RSE06973.1 class A beta-lactamase-related serine hydrolase [Atlantibacter subterranea]RSE26090.1 class A beta-lactamase-related serine hydrolase [Atlantibacter subterranea]
MQNTTKQFRWLLLVVPLLSGCGTLSQMSSPAGTQELLTHESLDGDVDSVVRHYMAQKSVSGMTVAVIHNHGEPQYYSWGVTDETHRYPVRPDTLFALGSLSKGVTAEVVTCLVNEGRLSWDDKLAALLPPGTPLSVDARNITLLELVTHTSGLPRQNMDLPMLKKFIGYLGSGENFYGELDSDNVLDYLARWQAPQSKVPEYSNLGYALIGYILKYKTGEDIQTLAARYIFRPLNMASTSFTPEQLKGFPQRALGHAGDQPKFIPRGQLTPDWHFDNNMVAAASLYSNAEDLIAYARYHVSKTDNSVLDVVFAEVSNIYYQRPEGSQEIAWATDFIGREKITYQVGYIGGYSSFIGFDKEKGNAVVVLQNAFNWSNYIGMTLLLDMAKNDRQLSGNRFANN